MTDFKGDWRDIQGLLVVPQRSLLRPWTWFRKPKLYAMWWGISERVSKSWEGKPNKTHTCNPERFGL